MIGAGRTKGIVFAAAALLAAQGPVAARENTPDAVKMLDALEQCQAIPDPMQRLACFDTRIASLKQARQADKKFLSRDSSREFKPVESTTRAVNELQPGTWLLILADNSLWRTNDVVRVVPRAGETVKIRKGAFGSYLANIGKAPAVRVVPLR